MPISSGSAAPLPRRCHRFFKVFFPHLCSRTLRIPPAFEQHVEDEAPARFYLKGPSNIVWGVDLVKKSGGLFLANGWEEFASDHSLAAGDFLVFQYDGNVTFLVLIFDKTACEKEGAFSVTPTCENKSFLLDGDKGEVEEEGKTEDLPRKRKRALDDVVAVKETRKREKTSPSKNICANDEPLPKRKSVQKLIAQRISRRLGNCSTKISESSSDTCKKALVCLTGVKPKRTRNGRTDACQRNMWRGYISQRRPVSQKEIDRALQKAQSFKPRNPYCLMIMKDSYVYHGFYLALPGSFPFEYLPNVSGDIYLTDAKQKKWTVNYIRTERPALSAGWCRFAVTNNLEADDVCIFELIAKAHMKVHIFRVVEDFKPLLRFAGLKWYVETEKFKALMKESESLEEDNN
ncbi:B3 domain-containing protein [Apostasia shenzhenica]|uniref:B3 domain-containing protein n=1 Tax=Apostasia shenzhenica TaxID=1088818 RepID=A0A2I0AUH1_9ASPA|nr:B3 domain-containing protein [Apostasia shenzhenica]